MGRHKSKKGSKHRSASLDRAVRNLVEKSGSSRSNKKKGGEDRKELRQKLEATLKQMEETLKALDDCERQEEDNVAVSGTGNNDEEESLSGAFLRGSLSDSKLRECSKRRNRAEKRKRMSKRTEAKMCQMFEAMSTKGASPAAAAAAGQAIPSSSAPGELDTTPSDLPFVVVSRRELESRSWRDEERWQRREKESKKKAKRRRKEEAKLRRRHQKSVERQEAEGKGVSFVMRSPTLTL